MHLNLLTVTFFVIYWLSRGILRTLIIDESELFLLQDHGMFLKEKLSRQFLNLSSFAKPVPLFQKCTCALCSYALRN